MLAAKEELQEQPTFLGKDGIKALASIPYGIFI
jgi:hypothetical protein